jgi:predicted TIM-barrel fold metal-dependent hydrolase
MAHMTRSADTGASPSSAVIDPEIAVVDSHHHFWLHTGQRYLVEEFEADLLSGHRVIGSVYVECHSGYRRSGPDSMKTVGEAQFFAGEIARGKIVGGAYPTGFVGAADFTLGGRVEEVLDAQALESQGKLKGIRGAVYWDADPKLNLGLRPYSPKGLLLDPKFREGFACLASKGLVYDAWQYEPQLPELCSLADKFENAVIVVNHCGGPLGINAYATPDRFPRWQAAIRKVAERPNTVMKLSGLTAPRIGLGLDKIKPCADPQVLAEIWAPYIEACIEAFGPSRCMFGSNFPVDLAVCGYNVLISAYKLATRRYSAAERSEIFSGTANRVYGLNI